MDLPGFFLHVKVYSPQKMKKMVKPWDDMHDANLKRKLNKDKTKPNICNNEGEYSSSWRLDC